MGVSSKIKERIPRLAKLKYRNAKRVRLADILLALIMLLLGVVTIVFSHHISKYLHWVVGSILWLSAILLFFIYFHYKEFVDSKNGEYMLAWFLIVIGVLVVSVPSRSIIAISVAWGIWSIIKSVRELNEEIQLIRERKKVFFKTLFSLFELVMGTILLMELTDEAIGHHVIILGVSFISHGIKDLNAVFSKDYDKMETVASMRDGFVNVMTKASHAVDKMTSAMSSKSKDVTPEEEKAYDDVDSENALKSEQNEGDTQNKNETTGK